VTVAPVYIDPSRFAREQASASGTLAPAALSRLADQLCDTAGAIDYRVSGYTTDRGQPALRLEIDGQIELRCQRCLGALRFPLGLRREIVLTDDMDEFEQSVDEDDAVDTIPAASRLDLRELIEEEILLALPMVVHHADGACHADLPEQDSLPRRASPFEALAKLKLNTKH
jgi:uncharacterized protein